MYRTENWKELITKIAGEMKVSDSRESWLLRAARHAKISHWHAKAMFYEELRDPKWSIGIQVKNAANKIDQEIEKARLEAAKLTSQYTQIVRGTINVTSENLLGETAAMVLDTGRLLGGDHLPGNHGITIKKGDAT